MKTYKNEKQPDKKVIDSVVCDKCKKPIDKEEVSWGNYFSIEHRGGYGSEYPGDLITLEIDLCEPCGKEILGPFAVLSQKPFWG